MVNAASMDYCRIAGGEGKASLRTIRRDQRLVKKSMESKMKKIFALLLAALVLGTSSTAYSCPLVVGRVCKDGKCKDIIIDMPCPTAGGTTKRM